MRAQAMNALTQDLATPRGQDMVNEFMSRLDSNGSVEHVRVYIDADSGLGTYSVRGGNVMVLQPSDLLSSYSGRTGVGFFSYDRIFAHEMGHMAFGNNAFDDYALTNIKNNENAIMEQLGYTNDRMFY